MNVEDDLIVVEFAESKSIYSRHYGCFNAWYAVAEATNTDYREWNNQKSDTNLRL